MQKQRKVYEFGKATVIVEYTKIPGKAELEDACRRFLINAMRDRERYEEAEAQKCTVQN